MKNVYISQNADNRDHQAAARHPKKQNPKQREGVCSQLNPNDVYTASNDHSAGPLTRICLTTPPPLPGRYCFNDRTQTNDDLVWKGVSGVWLGYAWWVLL